MSWMFFKNNMTTLELKPFMAFQFLNNMIEHIVKETFEIFNRKHSDPWLCTLKYMLLQRLEVSRHYIKILKIT